MYEQRKWSNTYLLISEDGMQQKPMKLIVEGYFTLSNKVICIDDAVSNSTRKKIFGGILKENQYIHTILIGQLGKYIEDKYSSSLSMNELLDTAFEIIDKINNYISCRCVLLECRKYIPDVDDESREKLHAKYREYGFKKLQDDGELVQYFFII